VNAPQPFVRARHAFVIVLALALSVLAVLPFGVSAASPTPAWKLSVISMPTNFAPDADGDLPGGPHYTILAVNVGEGDAVGPITLTDTLPPGVTPGQLPGCSVVAQVVTCVNTKTVYAGGEFILELPVDVGSLADPTILSDEVTISSPGAAPVTATTTTAITSSLAPFSFIPGGAGLAASLTEADGSVAAAAGSHPSHLAVNLGFQSRPASHHSGETNYLTTGGGVRDVRAYLPHGLVIDPSATPVRCTEAQFETESCPDASVLGRVSTLLGSGFIVFSSDPLFNMVPPPGAASSFGFDPLGTGLHIHVLGGLRAGDYVLAGASENIPSLFNHPAFAVQLQFWGNPSSHSYDHQRGYHCTDTAATCPVAPQNTPAITTPTSCSTSLALEAEIDSWDDPGHFLSRSVPFTDLEGNPTGISGCNAVPFKPSLSAQPTTNLADSPSGLDVDLHVPQTESLATIATAHLKQATVTLPEGLVVNPSSANGLDGCSPSQIGIDAATGVANGEPAHCPNAAKIGTVEVDSPLLAQYDSENKIQRDPEGNAIAEPVPGSVYLAAPNNNPFNSLLAIYLALEDPAHGIIVKLAGKVEADPVTGRLTTTFADNPQLPFEDIKLHFFGGASAALKTPLTCGTKITSSDLTPWSTPEGADATPSDSFQTVVEPGGGTCPTSDAQAANNPAFSAGTVAPVAGAYSPLVLKLSREDGSAPISALEATLPPGLIGKLAGIAYCPDAALAAAAAKSGTQEKQSPSCAASSEVGSVTVGAGAGPTPYYTQGKAYLAGPYKGAPLSLAIVTPATAGPYDLGTVVIRAALFVNPETARIHAVSDPIPQILQGIPLDVRSIALKMDRPNFTLNPTSCDPMKILGSATAASGQLAPLTSPFQVGGCSALKFAPKLALSLKGATKRAKNPALKAVLTYPQGNYANIASAQVTLPHSEFLDQAHIGTVCTRVQFAAKACPAASIYGKASATTPLLDAPLSGPVYLRSSNNPLPDLVADLNGQIEVTLDGKVDTGKGGGIRNTFQAVPDAPVSRFVLEMQGGKKGLLVNSENICSKPQRALAHFVAQNGKVDNFNPVIANSCKQKSHKKKHQGAHK
jgi:hypothetical protein